MILAAVVSDLPPSLQPTANQCELHVGQPTWIWLAADKTSEFIRLLQHCSYKLLSLLKTGR